MELNDLKQAWSKFSASEANRHRMDEDELRRMLKRRTNSLMDRIDRNVRIGFAVMALLVCFFVVDDFILTPNLADEVRVPFWILVIDLLNTLFLLGTFLYFRLQYKTVRNDYTNTSDMRRVLNSSIRLLTTYRKLFYWSLAALLFVIAVSVTAGFFANPNLESEVYFEERNQLAVFQGLFVLCLILMAIFALFHWGFRRLYGRYIRQLKNTLAELDEIE